jgi:alpha,alpha-trehalase
MTFEPVLAYIGDYWPKIIRHRPHDEETHIGLPQPYMVPSHGAMFAEMYYWDSFFMSLGVIGTDHEHLVVATAENMAFLLERFGLIPNASRYYFLSRSQPPLFTAQIRLAEQVKLRRGDTDIPVWLERMARLAEQEHERVWLGAAQPHHRLVYQGLSRYFDINYLDFLASCESGWDHSNRCQDRWLDHVPVDLNAILYAREQDLADFYRRLGQPERASVWAERAAARAETIRRLMWDEQAGFFFDYDWRREQITPTPSLAGFYPLWAGLATEAQAERAITEWLPRFEKRGGLVTSLRARAGRQWAYPNGWAPLQWIVVSGLERYGYGDIAQRIMLKWCRNCEAVFAATGAMWEKYHVLRVGADIEEGLYGSVPGFGWSNAVFVDFVRRIEL